jgi:dipeptidase E
MKKLFLTSYFTCVARLLPDFAGDCRGKKTVFIPTAGIPEKLPFYIGADLKALKKLGLIVEQLEISTAPKDEIKAKLSGADYIFVSGGNTFFLLQELRRTGADQLIIEQVRSGKLYIGTSAGSAIASGNVEYVKFMDSPHAAPSLNEDYSSLGLVDFSIVPHYNNFPFKKLAAKTVAVYSDQLDLRPLSNHQAITVEGDKVTQIATK